MWSLGCIFYEIAEGGKPLFKGDCEFDMLIKITSTVGSPNEENWKEAFEFPYFKVQKLYILEKLPKL